MNEASIGRVCHHRDAEGTEKRPHNIRKRPFLCALCVSVVTYPAYNRRFATASYQEGSSATRPLIDELKKSAILQELSEDRLDAGLMATPLDVAGLVEEPLYVLDVCLR